MCHMSRATCHTSRVRCQVSQVNCNFFSSSFFFLSFLQSCGASWRRVCYQRGLPRLVINGLVRLKEFFWKIVNEKKLALSARDGHERSSSNLTWLVNGRAPVQSQVALYWTLDSFASCTCVKEWRKKRSYHILRLVLLLIFILNLMLPWKRNLHYVIQLIYHLLSVLLH